MEPETRPPASLPPETRMGEVHLAVADVDRALALYRDVLGFRVLRAEGDDLLLGADAPVLRLSPAASARPRPAGTTGLYHAAYLLPDRASLGRLIRRLVELQYPVEGASDHLVSEALYLSDPEGNGIEVYADRPRDAWRWGPDRRLHMSTQPMDVRGVLAAGGETPWGGMPEGTTLGHVHLHVGDVAATEAFYRDAVGFDLTTRYGDQATFLSAGGYHHHLAGNTWAGRGARPPPPDALGLRSYTVRLPDAEALDALEERVPGARRDGDVLVARDPAGNVVRFAPGAA